LGRLEEKGLALLCALAPDTGVLIGFRALQDARVARCLQLWAVGCRPRR
jgi:hypothetical protein